MLVTGFTSTMQTVTAKTRGTLLIGAILTQQAPAVQLTPSLTSSISIQDWYRAIYSSRVIIYTLG